MAFSANVYDFTALAAEPTRALRTRTAIDASLKVAPALTHHVIVHELSISGMRVESRFPLVEGTEAVFDIPDLGRLTARIVWRRETRYGCVFLTPLDLEQVKTTLAQAKVVWADFVGRASTRARDAGTVETTLFPMRRVRADEQTHHAAPDQNRVYRSPSVRWHPAQRLATIVGGTTALWATLGLTVFLIWG